MNNHLRQGVQGEECCIRVGDLARKTPPNVPTESGVENIIVWWRLLKCEDEADDKYPRRRDVGRMCTRVGGRATSHKRNRREMKDVGTENGCVLQDIRHLFL